jgi:pyruvate formate lyase activating enzyme
MGAFYEVIDAANVDLKGVTEEFYRHYTLSHLQPVLDTLRWLKRETGVWLEITNLIIPGANDSPPAIQQLCSWIAENLGDEVPVHFTAFHPDFRLRDRPPTSPTTLTAARAMARQAGLKYVYTGNVLDPEGQSTYCPGCGEVVVEREGYDIGAYRLKGGRCALCGQRIAWHFEDAAGQWGNRRLPVDVQPLVEETRQSRR